MSARDKLNTVYLMITCGVSALLGLATQSFFVFVLSFVILSCLLMNDGTIRPTPTRPGNKRQRN